MGFMLRATGSRCGSKAGDRGMAERPTTGSGPRKTDLTHRAHQAETRARSGCRVGSHRQGQHIGAVPLSGWPSGALDPVRKERGGEGMRGADAWGGWHTGPPSQRERCDGKGTIGPRGKGSQMG
jgi:hypothetical protein